MVLDLGDYPVKLFYAHGSPDARMIRMLASRTGSRSWSRVFTGWS
jgi:hypothetical protein